MTEAEFLKRLAKVKRKWWVSVMGFRWGALIRCGKRTCPILAVAGKEGEWGYFAAGREIGLTRRQVDRIVDAADRPMKRLKPELQKLRRKLLKACGLEG